MTSGKAVTQQQQHAPHHYSPEAAGAMALVGVIGIFVPVLGVLMIIRIIKAVTGRKHAPGCVCACHHGGTAHD